MAAIAPARARPLPGWWVTEKVAHRSMPSNFTVPAPFGRVIVSPSASFCLNTSPDSSLKDCILSVLSTYTFCGRPESTPRLPCQALSMSRGWSRAGNCENIVPWPSPAYVGTKTAVKPSCSCLPSLSL